MKFYKAGVPCVILCKSLVTELKNIVVGRKAFSLEELSHKLDSYEEYTCKSVPKHIQEIIADKISCIRLVMSICEEVEDIPERLKEMFDPKKDESHVQLSTIHKSKGKERDNIFILFPPIESHHARTSDQKQQEQNLHYVAITRTKNNLYWVYPS